MPINKVMKKLLVPSGVIFDTTAFLRQAGQKNCEGRVYWLGKEENGAVRLTRIAIPQQVARRTIYGVSVTVPQSANIEIARDLKPGEYIVAKVHSHPNRAYNSDVDKANPFLRHDGSISIIVPNFGRAGMDKLCNCAVCVFTEGKWHDLTSEQVKCYFSFE